MEVLIIKFADINMRFTEKVAEYINKGWTINSGTMSGSQTDEIRKVDLTDGKRIVRILLASFRDSMTRDECHEFGWHCFMGVKLVVGFDTEGCTPFNEDSLATIWNHCLDVIEEEKFYTITERRSYKDSMWYGTLEEAKQAAKLRKQRYRIANENKYDDVTDRFRDIALRYVRRQPRCKTYQAKDITVSRHTTFRDARLLYTEYVIDARSKTFYI